MSFMLDIGETTSSTNHEHRYAINPHGDGNTDIENNHLHLVINGKVMPAGDDNHSHDDVDFPLKGQENLLL